MTFASLQCGRFEPVCSAHLIPNGPRPQRECGDGASRGGGSRRGARAPFRHIAWLWPRKDFDREELTASGVQRTAPAKCRRALFRSPWRVSRHLSRRASRSAFPAPFAAPSPRRLPLQRLTPFRRFRGGVLARFRDSISRRGIRGSRIADSPSPHSSAPHSLAHTAPDGFIGGPFSSVQLLSAAVLSAAVFVVTAAAPLLLLRLLTRHRAPRA